MSEAPPSVPESPAPRPRRPLPRWVRWVIASSGALFLLMIYSWSQGVQSEARRQAALQQGVDALAEALTPSVLEGNPVKLGRLMTKIVASGRYKSAALYDPKGSLITATDSAWKAATDRNPALGRPKSEVASENGDIVIRRGVFLAEDNALAGLVIVVGKP